MIRLLASICCIVQCAGCISMDDLFPFGDIAEDTRLRSSDDGVSSAIQLLTDFPFYDANQRRIFVNNNGLLSFGTPTRVFTSQTFPIASARKGSKFQVIAPFWGDVDTSGSDLGAVWYRQTNNTILLQRVKNEISKYLPLYHEVDLQPFDPTIVFVATWDQVGYYQRQGDKRNTFQCVLVTDGKVSFAIFLYPEGGIEWTTGDGSGGAGGVGGTPAQVGFNAGDGIRSLGIPLSQTDGVIDIDELIGNTGEKGLWIFKVDREIISSGDCNNEGRITLLPNKGSLLGGTSITVTGPCFEDVSHLTCTFQGSFGSISVAGTSLDNRRALCVVPPIGYVGRLAFQLMLLDSNNETAFKSATFFSLSAYTSQKVNFADSNLLFTDGSYVTLTWKPKDVFQQKPSDSYSIDISLYALLSKVNSTAAWRKLRTVSADLPNWGTAAIQVPVITPIDHVERQYPIAFQITVNEKSAPDTLDITPGIWTDVAYYSRDRPSRSRCIDWIENTEERWQEQQEIEAQPPCPCTLQHAQTPGSGVFLDRSSHNHLEFFNPGAYICGYQLHTGKNNPRSPTRRQCCYDSTGCLIPGPPAGGHSALVYRRARHDQPLDTLLEHFEKDVIPFLHCCKPDDSLCAEYYKLRPSTTGRCAVLQNTPGSIFGDPHFVTFDAHKYTFNGRGEFTLVETEDELLNIQGRFTEAFDPSGFSVVATVLSAISIRDADSDIIQFQISRRGIETLVNREIVAFEENIFEIILKNAILIKEGNDAFSVRFNSGLLVRVQNELDYISLTIISLPESYIGQTRGLMGNFNGNVSDELLPMGFPIPLPTTSSLRTIHEGFGLTWINGDPSLSLFTYRSFQSFDTFFEPGFSAEFDPLFPTEALELQALELCGEQDAFCLFDIAVTGRLSVGNATKRAGRLWEQTTLLTQPVLCDPHCDNGVCTQNNSCKCQFGYKGPTCNTTVLVDKCRTNICSKIGTCRKLGVDTVCVCPPYTSGLNCENTIKFEIECTSNISDEVLSVRCNTTQPILNSSCAIDSQTSTPCTLPMITIDISSLEISAGNHLLAITARSILNKETSTDIKFEVKPVNLTCDGDIQEDLILVSDCISNNKIMTMECTINNSPKKDCKLPIVTDLTKEPPGRYILNITVVDVYKFRDAFILQYTKPSLRIDFLNSSPRVNGNSVLTDFYVNRPRETYSVKCFLTGQEGKDCSRGYVTYNALPAGTYTLRIVAAAIDGGRYVLRRRVYVGEDEDFCSVQLINSGVEVEGDRVSVHFVGSRATQYTLCRLDKGTYRRCRSPYRLDDISPGLHRIQVKPVCCKGKPRHSISMKFFA